jgi:arylsulfatase A-like enzyme
MAATAGMLGVQLPVGTAEDSVNVAPYLMGAKPPKPIRTEIVHHGLSSLRGYRRDFWKLINGRGSGGFSPDPVTTIYDPPGQLYDLAADLGERNNLYFEHRDLVCILSKALAQARCESTSNRGVLRTFALSE